MQRMINSLDMTHNLYTFFLTNLTLSPKLILGKKGLTPVQCKFKMHFSTLVPLFAQIEFSNSNMGSSIIFGLTSRAKNQYFFATVAIMNLFFFLLFTSFSHGM